MIRKVVIVGGGTAGWITAGMVASRWGQASGGNVNVTLIESPDIKTIGVGEGTWPTMRETLQVIGLEEKDFMVSCSAAFKQGTKFVGWLNGSDEDHYYHPFTPPSGYPRFDLTPFWQERRSEVSFVDAVTAQGKACDLGLAPQDSAAPEYAGLLNYGYHLDAGQFADRLQRHCTGRLGVRHLRDNVTTIKGSPEEDIQALLTERNGELRGDLFIDCTGMASMLLGKHYGVPYIDRSDILFNDRALAVQVPYADDHAPVASQTLSTARENGWVWDIGLPTRRGVGYTWSSRHGSDERAERVLRDYLMATGALECDDIPMRKIAFQPGHRKAFWHRNCVAVGMSAGFLEPLEASALVLVELSAKMICDRLPANREVMDHAARRFNDTFRYRWDRIIEFLKLHYVLSQREDSGYWVDHRNRQTIPDRLEHLLQLWRHQFPRYDDFERVDEVFSAASYQYVLYGMDFQTAAATNLEANRQEAQRRFIENSRATRMLLQRLPEHRTLLTHRAQEPGRAVGG